MSLSFPKDFVLFFSVIFFSFLFTAQAVSACSCGAKPTVLDSYEGSDVVVIARAVAVEKSVKGEGVHGIRSTEMIVEKVFKGGLKVGDKMTFAQGGGADCIWTFDEKSIDNQFLFYLHTFTENPGVWIAFTCGRSNLTEYVSDDLLYLENMKKLRGRTRISGTLDFLSESDQSLAERKIRILGTNKTYEVKTDKHGVYEIYDLPPGKYLVEPEIPAGWRVDSFYLGYSASFAGNDRLKSPKQIPIILEDRKHAALDINFEIDNAVRGRIYDPSGNPMRDVCLKLIPARADATNYPYLADCTEPDGRFSIEVIPPGSYVLVINEEGEISSSEPFGTFYYPNVFERERAAVITIGVGEHLEDLNVHAPGIEETTTIEGRFLYLDGKPVVDERVEFKADKTDKKVDGEARASTDSNGRFSIRILKGLKGQLYGAMYTYVGEFENCPKLNNAIKATGQDVPELKTPFIDVQAEKDLYDIKLKFPFPGCKKAKE